MKHCPRDTKILASNDVDGYRYYTCSQCNGYWIPGKVLRNTMRSEIISDIVSRSSQKLSTTLPCSDCKSHMVALIIKECEIDICPGCSAVWLDNNEVLRIADCFKEDSAFVQAEQSLQDTRSGSKSGLIVLTAIDLLFALAP